MTPFDVFVRYCTVKAHFRTESFNMVKYHGVSKHISRQSFNKRNDKYYFIKLSNDLPTSDVVGFFISQFIDSRNVDNIWIGDMVNEGRDRFLDWKARIKSINYRYEQDIKNISKFLNNRDLTYQDIYAIIDDKHPLVFRFLLEDMIMPETYIILDRIFIFHEDFDRTLDDPIWEAWELKLRKYGILFGNTDEKLISMTKEHLKCV